MYNNLEENTAGRWNLEKNYYTYMKQEQDVIHKNKNIQRIKSRKWKWKSQ